MQKKLISGITLLCLSPVIFAQEIEQKKGIFVDEFNGVELSSEWKWAAGLAGSSYDLKTNPGFLTLTAPGGAGMWEQNLTAPKLSLIPKGAYQTITAKLTDYQPTGEWQEAGLFIWQDENTWFKLMKAYDGKQEIVIAAGYIYGKGRDFGARECKEKDIWLRIEKKTDSLLFQYSTDGKTFITIGRLGGGMASEFSNPQVGLYAANGPNTVKFDFFKVE